MYTIYQHWFLLTLQHENGKAKFRDHPLTFQFEEHAIRAAGEMALQFALDRDFNNQITDRQMFHEVKHTYFSTHGPETNHAFRVYDSRGKTVITFYVVEE